MARPLRLEFEGAVYHVTSRGDGKENIFLSDSDRLLFLGVLAETIKRFLWGCHAYSLMPNHYHLLIETPDANLSRGMRHLNGVYTQRFNRRHRRTGHVFQGRYKAIVVQKDAHLLELCRYVVLNPVRAGLTGKAEDWRWSSYRATIGDSKRPEWLTTDWVLRHFGKKRLRAVHAYRQFVREGLGRKPWKELVGQIYYGGEKFIKDLEKNEEISEVPRIQRRPFRPPLTEWIKRGTPEEIKRASVDGGYRLNEIAKHLGVHYATVSRRLKEALNHGTNM